MNHWRDHVNNAEDLLAQAQMRGDVPAKVLDCLYKVIVEVTHAVVDLERKPGEEEYDQRHRI